MDYVGFLDVSGIQAFIGASHKLKEIAGRSRYVAELTEDGGLYERAARRSGIEPIILAGGNAAFRSKGAREPLEEAFRIASRELIEAGTRLELVGAIHEYDPGSLAGSYPDALLELERRKLTQPRSTSFAFSGMKPPAPDGERDWSAPEQAYQGRLWEPTNFDDVIMTVTRDRDGHAAAMEKSGLMGVVSVDGLGMGARLMAWLRRMAEESPSDDEFIARFRAWSDTLKVRWDEAWAGVLDELDGAFTAPDRVMQHTVKSEEYARLRNRAGGDGHFLPCRRIYQGGDDMIFVADARLALSMAASLAAKLAADMPGAEAEFRSVRVTAGVVFVDSRFPFSRSRSLADEVRASAKRRTVRIASGDPLKAESALSWWTNRQGALDPDPGRLSLKPYALTGASEMMAWSDLETRVLGGMWRSFGIGRNKLKDILAVADKSTGEAGAAAVQSLLTARPLTDEQTLDWLRPTHDPATGFDAQRNGTPLLDAGELFDIHWPLST